MNKIILFFSAILLLMGESTAQHNITSEPIIKSSNQQIAKSLRGNGMMFTQNKGQIVDMEQHQRPDILFKGGGGGADVFLRKTGISYLLNNIGDVMHEVEEQIEGSGNKSRPGEVDEKNLKEELLKKQTIKLHRIDIDFVNSNSNVEIQTADQVEGCNSYYYAHCPQGITNVNSFNQITTKNIYNNIDVKYYGDKAQGLKYDIIINPGGDPNNIKLKYSGAEKLSLSDGHLSISTSLGTLGEYMPKVYQNINGRIVDVKAEYKLNSLSEGEGGRENFVTFELGTWNPEHPLIIDPWLSYLGGSGIDMGESVATDATGNAIFTGNTSSVNFPVFAGIQMVNGGGGFSDGYVIKMNAAGNRIWATYYGGSKSESNTEVTIDILGNILITGTTSSTNFPIGAVGANVVYQIGPGPIFILKLSPAGAKLWATYYASSGESASNIATDGSNVYITATARDFGLATAGAFQPSLVGFYNAILVKFLSNGTLVWSTYIGGGNENPYAVACDLVGNIYVGGSAYANFPTTPGAFQVAQSGGTMDGFLCKLNPAGGYIWGTYYGGAGQDNVIDITIDNLNNVVIIGATHSNIVMASAGGYCTVYNGGYDGFAAKFNSLGSRQWATYMGLKDNGGGGPFFYGGSVATDNNNNIYVYGEVEEGWDPTYPTPACAYQPTNGAGAAAPALAFNSEDQFIAKYNPAGVQKCFTWLGGPLEDELDFYPGGTTAIAIYGNCLYITGFSLGSYPVTLIPPSFQTIFAGGFADAFMDQLCTNLCEAKVLALDYTANTTNVCVNAPVVYTPTVANSCDTTGYRFQWTFTGGSPASSTVLKPTVTYPAPGTYPVKLVLTTLCKTDSLIKTSYITVNGCSCSLSALAATITNVSCSGANNGSVSATVSSGSGGSYTYSWSTGASTVTTSTTNQLNNLAAGIYTVTVTDGSCVFLSTATVTKALGGSFVTPTNLTCSGVNTGSATVSVSGGSGSYSYSWSNGTTANTTSSTHQINNLSAGTYTVTITQSSCTITSTVTITAPQAIAIGGSAQWISCLSNGGIATVITANGASPYTYLWSTGNTGSIVTGLNAGTYSITVTDANGCTITKSITAAKTPMVITTFSTNISCGNYAQLRTTVTGYGPFTYNWNNGMVGANINGVAAGAYTVTITDGSGCTATRTFNVSGSSTVNASFTQSPSTTICVGATVNFINTGVSTDPQYIAFQWYVSNALGTNIGSATTNNYSYTFTSAGTYNIFHQVRIKYSPNTCQGTAVSTVKVIDCSGPTVTASPTSVCNGSCATVTATGSAGTTPYTYSWNTGATTQNINPCPVTNMTYTITITDSGGATATTSVLVTVNPVLTLTATATNISCNGGGNGSVIANPGSGTSPYVYNWSNGQTTQTTTGLTAGNYTVTITDSKGCTATSTTSINSPPPFVGQFAKGTANCTSCGCKEWIMVTATGGTSPYSYSWPALGGYMNRYKNQLCPGSYSINIKDKNGCSVNVNITAP